MGRGEKIVLDIRGFLLKHISHEVTRQHRNERTETGFGSVMAFRGQALTWQDLASRKAGGNRPLLKSMRQRDGSASVVHPLTKNDKCYNHGKEKTSIDPESTIQVAR